MKMPHKAVAGAGLLLVAGLAAWAMVDSAPSGMEGASSRGNRGDTDARLAALEAKVDRLAALLEAEAGRRAGAGSASRVAAATRATQEGDDTAEARAARAQLVGRLESEFASERTDPVWSRTAEAQLQAIGMTDAILAIEARPPVSRQVECRTRRCRLSFDFDDTADAEDWSIAFSTSAGRSLRQLVYFVTPLPGGKARVTMYGNR